METVVVFGADSTLGESVTKSLRKHYAVKAVSLSEKRPDAGGEHNNVTFHKIDVSNPGKIRDILDGTSRVFVSTNTDFNSPDGYNEEVHQGEVIAEACSRAAVKHVVFHTALSVVQILGPSARHMDAKCAIGDVMKRLNLPLTFVTLPCFYEDLLQPPLKPKKLPSGAFSFEIASGNCALDWMSVEDVGDVVTSIFQGRDEYLNKTLNLSANKLAVSEISTLMTKHIQPIRFVDNMMTVDEMRLEGFPGAADLANMFDFYCRVDQRTNINLTKKLNPKTRSFEDWIHDHLELIDRAFCESN